MTSESCNKLQALLHLIQQQTLASLLRARLKSERSRPPLYCIGSRCVAARVHSSRGGKERECTVTLCSSKESLINILLRQHEHGIVSDAEVFIWGRGEYGRLGLGDRNGSSKLRATHVPGLERHCIVQVHNLWGPCQVNSQQGTAMKGRAQSFQQAGSILICLGGHAALASFRGIVLAQHTGLAVAGPWQA